VACSALLLLYCASAAGLQVAFCTVCSADAMRFVFHSFRRFDSGGCVVKREGKANAARDSKQPKDSYEKDYWQFSRRRL
jgi:hypothetical protein